MYDQHEEPYEQLPLKAIIHQSLAAQEKKKHRRKVLEAVRERRQIIYQRFSNKRKQSRSWLCCPGRAKKVDEKSSRSTCTGVTCTISP